MSQDRRNREPDAPVVTAMRGKPFHQVARNHLVFGLAIVVALVAVLSFAGVLPLP